MEQSEWFLYTGKGQQGPYTREQILAWLGDGTVSPDWYVWRDGMAEWKRIGDEQHFNQPQTVKHDRQLDRIVDHPLETENPASPKIITYEAPKIEGSDFEKMLAGEIGLEQADKYIKNAFIAGCVSGSITLIVTLIALGGHDLTGVGGFLVFDAILIFGLTYGIYKKSRWAAVAMFVYFVVSKGMQVAGGNTQGIGIGLLFLYFYFQGVRGTFARHLITAPQRTNG